MWCDKNENEIEELRDSVLARQKKYIYIGSTFILFINKKKYIRFKLFSYLNLHKYYCRDFPHFFCACLFKCRSTEKILAEYRHCCCTNNHILLWWPSPLFWLHMLFNRHPFWDFFFVLFHLDWKGREKKIL